MSYDYDVENYNIPSKEESNNVVNNQPSNYNNMEYNYEINANTGNILKHDLD